MNINKDFSYIQDGDVFSTNIKKNLQKLHRRVSRKRKGSKNRNKVRIRLARKYEPIYNRKKDWTHKISHNLAEKYDVIILGVGSSKRIS